MAINVKKLKRVIQGNEPLKVLNSGDKKPAFRQNGYGLTFDAANSDFILLSSDFVFEDGKTVSFDIDFDLGGTLVLLGKVAQTNTYIQVTGGSVQIRDNVTGTSVNFAHGRISNIKSVSVSFVGTLLGVVVDGVDLGTQTAGTTQYSFNHINKRTSFGYYSFTLFNFSLNNETYSLTESRGTTTTGSLGTTATINTSNAGGVQYLDSTVWNKKSFALIGEPLDNEKVTILGVDYPLSATPITEIEHLGETFLLKEGLGNQVYGDSGTIGAISTDNVLGIERINYGMWLKGDDTNGWNPYT